MLVGGIGAGPDLDLGARAAVPGVVKAAAGLGVDQLAVGLDLPLLGTGAVAPPLTSRHLPSAWIVLLDPTVHCWAPVPLQV